MKNQEDGIGKLFTDPDPDKAREFFRKKSRKLKNKLMPVQNQFKFTIIDLHLMI